MSTVPNAQPAQHETAAQPAVSRIGRAPAPFTASMAQAARPASTVLPNRFDEGNGAANDVTATRIILVEWRIKKGRENEFLEYWSKCLKVPDRSGLVAEFLSQAESREQYPWITWQFGDGWTTFITTGLWREAADFQRNFGAFIDDSKPLLDFEAQRRRRVLLAPARWRVGGASLPAADHPACAEPAQGLLPAEAEPALTPSGLPESRPEGAADGALFGADASP